MSWSILWQAFLNGVIPGVVASAIFLFLLFLLKPKIVISDKIASQYVKVGNKDHHAYVFKIINKSLFFKIYDLKVNAYVCSNMPNVNGNNVNFKDIQLKGADQWVLNRMYWKHIFQNTIRGERTLESRCDYACQFFSGENISNLLDNNSYISVQVLAKHSLTGFSRVKIRKYNHSSKIVKGIFLSGNSCRIVSVNDKHKTVTD
ncbi:hypothetical protein HDF19_10095 [Mucilaginibacter sp. E4BP6]|uniref:hypothetical protein n=1 Tax=Mucilaginibacter sp. E4BP6 TaxID=2723089 RepID=UPI0015CA29A3|nr:hypothetical protein [Mucilaginibacter sp. E4BP6]NYE68668.1 hypothetical protein [Mucilaginibacter sp. E4BP6]